MICFVEERVLFCVDECVFVLFIEFEQIFDNLFGVYVNARFLFVDRVGENDYVHEASLAFFGFVEEG